jgi:hypothetical protein
MQAAPLALDQRPTEVQPYPQLARRTCAFGADGQLGNLSRRLLELYVDPGAVRAALQRFVQDLLEDLSGERQVEYRGHRGRCRDQDSSACGATSRLVGGGMHKVDEIGIL